jgi:hypothetical protein
MGLGVWLGDVGGAEEGSVAAYHHTLYGQQGRGYTHDTVCARVLQ